jgi:hypothetical protein
METSFKVVLDELKRIRETGTGKQYSHGAHLTEDDIQRWCGLIGEPRSALYDQIAIYLARGFHTSELDFEFCDAVANDMHYIIISADDWRPNLFWEVYLAFDEGEYYHANNRDEDPVERYTRPLIAQIVKRYPQAS